MKEERLRLCAWGGHGRRGEYVTMSENASAHRPNRWDHLCGPAVMSPSGWGVGPHAFEDFGPIMRLMGWQMGLNRSKAL